MKAITNPAAAWAEGYWILPETGRPIVLRPWQRKVLAAMFPADGSPSRWETFLIANVKKSGKTTLDAIATTYAATTFPAPETAFCVANDEGQAQERVFELIAAALRAMGLERSGAIAISKGEIRFAETGTRIVAIPADFAGAAGAVFGISSWTETWAFRHEGHVRLWEELTPIPNRRSLRIVDSYAGFTGDSPVLEPMWNRALAGERLDGHLPIFANGRLWAYIDQGEEAQTRAWRGTPEEAEDYYAEQRASLRPGTFARLHLNQWQSGESAFVTAEAWDRCVIPDMRPLVPGARDLVLSVGVDAATKHDCAAVVAVARDGERVILARHKIWTPRKGDPIDLEETVERYLLELAEDFTLGEVRFDPYQFQRSAQTLKKRGVPVIEYPQTTDRLTASGQALFDLVHEGRLAMYPDAELRAHALNAVAIETARGWRLSKEKASRKIDGAVALSFAVLGALRETTTRLTSHSGLPWAGGREESLERGRLLARYDAAGNFVGSRHLDLPPRSSGR